MHASENKPEFLFREFAGPLANFQCLGRAQQHIVEPGKDAEVDERPP